MNKESSDHAPGVLGELEGKLRNAVAELHALPVPMDSVSRVASRAAALPTTYRPTRRRWVSYSLLSVSSVAAIVAVVTWFTLSPHSWAQVVEAVRQTPWIHGTMRASDGKVSEFWASFSRDVAARQSGDWAQFCDFRTKTRYEYRREEGEHGTLYREPLNLEADFALFQKLFLGAMRGDKTLASPFLNSEITVQEQRTVVESGQTWTDYDLALRMNSASERAIRLVVRVDPTTKLPASMKITSLSDKLNDSMEMAFDYPDEKSGPVDIYDLGAPRNSQLVDRMPSTELAQVISAVQTGQRKFGPYFAVVAHLNDRSSKPWETLQVDVVWRKGSRFRIETARVWPDKRPERPADGADMIAWWKECLKGCQFFPQRVCDGKNVWLAKFGGSDEKAIKWEKFRGVHGDDDFYSYLGTASSEQMPDAMAYGSPPIPTTFQDVRLLSNSPDGPPGCLLAEARVVRQQPGAYHLSRYWYDPSHAYVMRRSEHGDLQPVPDDGPSTDCYEAETISQRPSGVWYPTCVRRKYGPEPKDEYFLWYFVDFNASVPDSVFKPVARTGDIE